MKGTHEFIAQRTYYSDFNKKIYVLFSFRNSSVRILKIELDYFGFSFNGEEV